MGLPGIVSVLLVSRQAGNPAAIGPTFGLFGCARSGAHPGFGREPDRACALEFGVYRAIARSDLLILRLVKEKCLGTTLDDQHSALRKSASGTTCCHQVSTGRRKCVE